MILSSVRSWFRGASKKPPQQQQILIRKDDNEDSELLDDSTVATEEMPELLAEAFAVDEMECGICCSEKLVTEFVGCSEGHPFCGECVKNHAQKSEFGHGNLLLKCLDAECQGSFTPGMLTKVLDEETMKYIDQREREANLRSANLNTLEFCRYCGFGVLIDVPKERDKVFRCGNSECGREVCRICGRDWDECHIGVPCSEIKDTITDDRARKQLEERLSKAVVRYCHKCCLPFEKVEGCNRMQCRCGAKMCYICRTPDITYSHFCQHAREPGDVCGECNCCFLWEDPRIKDSAALEKIEKEFRNNLQNGVVEAEENEESLFGRFLAILGIGYRK